MKTHNKSNIVNNVSELIGQTPILCLNDMLFNKKFIGVNFYLKLECVNPGLSIKDRTALGLIMLAEKSGKLKPGSTIVESSSGNLGHSLAMICASKGYKFICILDPKSSKQNINILEAFGATSIIVEQPDELGSYQSIRIKKAQELAIKNNYINLDQYNNIDAVNYHAMVTGPEIESQVPNIDIIFGGISTGSHLSGIGKHYKSSNCSTKIIGVEPEGSIISGGTYKPYLQNGIGLSFTPKNYLAEYIDHVIQISDKDAFEACHYMAKKHGIFLGGSSGSILSAIYKFTLTNSLKNINILGIMPDGGIKYTETVYNNDWLESYGL